MDMTGADLQAMDDAKLLQRWLYTGIEVSEELGLLQPVARMYDVMELQMYRTDLVWAGQRYAKALAAHRAIEDEMIRRWGNST